jgi:hypothetical protein
MERAVSVQETQLLEALLAKTLAGKISWRESATPDEYISAIGGKQVYVLRRFPQANGLNPFRHVIQLEVRDPEHQTSLFELEYENHKDAIALFRAVKNLHVNDRLAESLELINQL